MIAIVWEFTVRPESIDQFQKAYGARGDWAVLFKRHRGYKGTTLLQDTASAERFLTIDRWDSDAQFNEMRGADKGEYSRLDRMCDERTVSEHNVGVFRLEED